MIRRYRQYDYVFVGSDFFTDGGAWRSVYALYRHKQQHGESVLLIDLRSKAGLRQWLGALLFSKRVVVNGMAAVGRWRVLLPALFRSDLVFYLHDTEYMLDQFCSEKPTHYRVLSFLLQSRYILCVSKKMEALYRTRFGAVRSHVVYELTQTNPRPSFNPSVKNILMVGSLSRRKGFPLFVAVANHAKALGYPFVFHWIGPLGEQDLLPDVNSISWLGWCGDPGLLVASADLFFLSSVDDPQPLVCLEALALHRRIVAYAGTGTSELIQDLPGCRTFAEYSVESALCSILEALEESPDSNLIQARLNHFCSPSAMESAIACLWQSDHEDL